jgi:hypothetical protein
MRKTSKKSEFYEITPARMIIPAEPHVANERLDAAEVRSSGELRIDGASTVPCETQAAEREAQEMLAQCREQLRRGNRYALIELLDANPWFIADAWVAEQLLRLKRGGLPLRRRGRVRGRYQFHPLVVAGLVRYLMERGEAATIEQAFGRLAEIGLLSYATAKDLFYRARRDDRFRPIMLTWPELAERVPAAVAETFLRRAEVLAPGKPVTRSWEDPERGRVDVTMRTTSAV